MSKSIIVYYSRTGNTKTVSKYLQDLLDCDLVEISDKKNRKGFFNLFKCVIDSSKDNITEIEYENYDLSNYDNIYIASPIWASNIPPAIRTYLTLEKSKIVNYNLILTYKGSNINKAIKEIAEILDTYPSNTIDIKKGDIKNNSFINFLDGLKNI